MPKLTWMMTKRGASIGSAGLLAASALTSPAFAQDQTPQDANRDNAIIVTAQLREQNEQDIPLAITAISGAMLEARSQTNIAEISAHAPNVVRQMNPAGFGNSMRAFI